MLMSGCWVISRFSTRVDELYRSVRSICVLSIVIALVSLFVPLATARSNAQVCGTEAIADLVGSGNTAILSGSSRASCRSGTSQVNLEPQPYFTHEIACTTDRRAAAAGLCSTMPCSTAGQFLAFRTSVPAGFQCVTLSQATSSCGVTAAQVFAAIWRVMVSGGEIGVVFEVRSL